MADEVYSWMEGAIALSTGSFSNSAVPAYAQNLNLTLTHGYLVTQSLSGTYRRHLTGQQADLSFAFAWADSTVPFLIASATATHIKIINTNNLNQSGGFFLWSGVFNVQNIAGADMGLFAQQITYQSNLWSAF